MQKKIKNDVKAAEKYRNELFTPYFETSRNSKHYKRVKWNEEEQIRYINFLSKNMQHFNSQRDRRQTKVFVQASQTVKTKTYKQVKSHHQKMMLKYGSIQEIIASISKPPTLSKVQNCPLQVLSDGIFNKILKQITCSQNNQQKLPKLLNLFDIQYYFDDWEQYMEEKRNILNVEEFENDI